MTPVEVLAAHHFDGREYEPGKFWVECGEGCWVDGWPVHPIDRVEAIRLHAAHVLDALTKAGHAVVDAQTVKDIRSIAVYVGGPTGMRLRDKFPPAETGGKA